MVDYLAPFRFTLGVPVGPMLAKPTRGISEVLDKLQGLTFICEYKYDGERTQVRRDVSSSGGSASAIGLLRKPNQMNCCELSLAQSLLLDSKALIAQCVFQLSASCALSHKLHMRCPESTWGPAVCFLAVYFLADPRLGRRHCGDLQPQRRANHAQVS